MRVLSDWRVTWDGPWDGTWADWAIWSDGAAAQTMAMEKSITPTAWDVQRRCHIYFQSRRHLRRWSNLIWWRLGWWQWMKPPVFFSDLCHNLSLQAHFNNKINLVPKICLFQHFASMLSMQLKPRECSFPDKTIWSLVQRGVLADGALIGSQSTWDNSVNGVENAQQRKCGNASVKSSSLFPQIYSSMFGAGSLLEGLTKQSLDINTSLQKRSRPIPPITTPSGPFCQF